MFNKGYLFFLIIILAFSSIFSPIKAAFTDSAEVGFWASTVPPKAYYIIDALMDTSSKSIIGNEIIRLKNQTTKPISRLALDWSINNRQTIEITIATKNVSILGDSGQTNFIAPLCFDLPAKLLPGDSIELSVRFQQPVIGLSEQDRITLPKWYPRLWWGFKTQDDFNIKIRTPPMYVLATSGLFDSLSGYYHGENITTFGLFLGKKLQISEAYSGDVLVRCLYTPEGETCAKLILETAVDAIDFYRERFGFYPYKSLDIVPGFSEPYGGYPAATSLVVIHGEEKMSEKPKIHWQWITAHEIGHMYWGEHVIEKDYPGWLWIGLGICNDREYIISRGLSLEMHREVMSRYTSAALEHVNTTVAITPDELHDIDFDFNNVVVHGKGFSIISALTNYLGKEIFLKICKRCLNEFGGHRLGTAEFQTICEEISNEDLGWFFDQWIHSNFYLSYQIVSQNSSKENNHYVTNIKVERLGMLKMPVPVAVFFQDGTQQQKFTDRLLEVNELKFLSNSPPVKALLDPDSELALIVPPPEMTKEEVLKELGRAPYSGVGKEAFVLFDKIKKFDITDENKWFKLGLMLYDGEYYQQAIEAFKFAAKYAKDSSNIKFGAIVWQGQILDLQSRREEAISQYKKALNIECGQQLSHGQYGIVINRRWVEEHITKPFHR